MQEILLATANPHKVNELRSFFSACDIPIISLANLNQNIPEPEEHGTTFEENAAIKALAYARATGHICLADDSGLEVDALNGAPGVISSHYATGGRDTGLSRDQRDKANNEKLLRDLENTPPHQRTARFVCIMTLAQGTSSLRGESPHILTTTRGTFEGRIGHPSENIPRGQNGFGYDPLFITEDGRTSAELSPEEKNARSHRAAAARAMADEIIRLFGHPSR